MNGKLLSHASYDKMKRAVQLVFPTLAVAPEMVQVQQNSLDLPVKSLSPGPTQAKSAVEYAAIFRKGETFYGLSSFLCKTVSSFATRHRNDNGPLRLLLGRGKCAKHAALQIWLLRFPMRVGVALWLAYG